MSNCSQHRKEVLGVSDMKVLAEMIGDLHYESLHDLLVALYRKVYEDGKNDKESGREQLGESLKYAAYNLHNAAMRIQAAWEISKPFMDNTHLK